MTGGIYCEVPLRGYNERTLGSVKSRMLDLFGTTNGFPTTEDFNIEVINYWYKKVSKKMASILSSWKVPGNRGYYNRTVDLTRSICLGIYFNGKLRKMYRFTGGHSELTPYTPSDYGSMPSKSTAIKLNYLGMTRHPDPAIRAQQFLDGYNLINTKGFVLVVAATMPYAVKLEITLRLPVLSMVINRILQPVYEFGSGRPFYGYIFEKTGEAQTGDEPPKRIR